MQHTRTLVIRALIALAIADGAAAQTPTVVISPVPMIQFFDNNGKPLAGGCVATYQAGTTTPLQTFTNSTGMVANQNPVMLDASGRAPIWINVNAIKYVVKAKSSACSLSSGTILYTTDGVQDQGLRLRSDLAGANGAGNIGIQQPGGIPITVQGALGLCPDASQYASLAAAIASVPTGGCLNCTSALTGPVTIANVIAFHMEPGCIVKATSNAPAITITTGAVIDGSGGTVDGQFSQSAFAGHCILANGGTGGEIRGITIRNCGNQGVHLTTLTGWKVHNLNISATQGDSLEMADGIVNVEVYALNVDTTTTSTGSHCVTAHSTGTNQTANGVFGVNIHDIIATAGQTNPCIEIGYFGSARPIPAWPSNITIAHAKGTVANATQSFFVSLSNVQNYSVSDIQLDDNGHIYLPLELAAASHGQVWGVTEINPNAAQVQSILINNSSWVDLSGFDIKGQIQVFEGTQPVGGEPTSMSHVAIHGGKIALQPSFPQATFFGPIWVQQSLPAIGAISDVNIYNNQLAGVSTTDGNIAVVLENDTGAGTMLDTVKVHHNSLSNIQYGFSNRTNNGTVSNIDIAANSLGAGVTECAAFCAFFPGQLNNFAVNQTGTGNKLGLISSFAAAGLVATGAKPTCTPGAGAGAGATCTVFVGTPFHGLLLVTAGTGSAGGTAVTMNMPITYVSKPYCTWVDGGNTSTSGVLVVDRVSSTATSVVWSNLVALANTNSYSMIYDCPLTPF